MTTDIRTDIPVDIHPGVLSQYSDVLNQPATMGVHALNDGLGALTEIYSTAIAAFQSAAAGERDATTLRRRMLDLFFAPSSGRPAA